MGIDNFKWLHFINGYKIYFNKFNKSEFTNDFKFLFLAFLYFPNYLSELL